MINSDSVLSPNERVIVAIIAIIIHVFLAIVLFVKPVWERPIPPPEPVGITFVSFGNVKTPTPTPAPSQSEFMPSVETNENQITEQSEEVKDIVSQKQTPNIQSTKNDNNLSVPDTKKETKNIKQKKEIPKETQKDETEQKTKEIKKQKETTQKPKEKNTTTSNTETDSKTKDKQGNSEDTDITEKVGVKDGTQISVSGWRWITKPKPKDELNEQGKIVFDITIDQNGNVIHVKLVEQSSTIGIATYTAYKKAILDTKFERTVFSPATEATVGRLTFNIKVGK